MPFWSKFRSKGPKSPFTSTSDLVKAVLGEETNSGRLFYFNLSSGGSFIGQFTVKIFDAGPIGSSFCELTSMSHGFGYKGSRIYATCPNEWCLIGDLLYDAPAFLPNDRKHSWVKKNWIGKKSTRKKRKSCLNKENKPPTIFTGDYDPPTFLEETGYAEEVGSVVGVLSSLQEVSGSKTTWTVGPQFKIILSETCLRSGLVIGQVISGLDVVRRASQMRSNVSVEPTQRITIEDCGPYKNKRSNFTGTL